jgi:hypothetical protein
MNKSEIIIDSAQDTLNIFLEDLLSDKGQIRDKTISQLEYELKQLKALLNSDIDDTTAHTTAQLINLIELCLDKYKSDKIVYNRIRSQGNSAAVFLPLKFRGCFARVIITD